MKAAEIKIGSRVSYEDMANPRLEGEVVEVIESRWGIQYRVRFEDDSTTISDLRQCGWKAV